ncbi:hypothetical protein Y032_0934g3104 [Ancylostoma ceylanicum]|uniref:Uncharacterized protein n=1 Tax=Ancylostoma ceylanicum TaxID=53326 RepID=A0A016W908_9BILA|nr:hypothetical protein Y032_0934g3104 [Ancylostoma ceylanicum]
MFKSLGYSFVLLREVYFEGYCFDRVCNQDIRNRFGVAAITGKLRNLVCECMPTFLVLNREPSAKSALIYVLGKRPKGRLKQRWLKREPNTLHAYLKLAGIHSDQAHDRARWRQRTSKAGPATKRDKR